MEFWLPGLELWLPGQDLTRQVILAHKVNELNLTHALVGLIAINGKLHEIRLSQEL